MFNSWSCLNVALLCSLATANQAYISENNMPKRIASPGQAIYYLKADAGTSVGPTDELKRTNRSLLKWWEDLFGQCNSCGSNNCLNNKNLYQPGTSTVNGCNTLPVGLQLQTLDPFKQIKLFKKLPDLWGSPCSGGCGNFYQQQQPYNNNFVEPVAPAYGGTDYNNNYGEPVAPGYSGDDYAPPAPAANTYTATDYTTEDKNYNISPTEEGYDQPASDGPGNGDAANSAAGYATPTLVNNDAPASNYEAPVSTYEAPSSPGYNTAAVPASAAVSYSSKFGDYDRQSKNYGGVQPPQIVYQPIIYVSSPTPANWETKNKIEGQKYADNQQEAVPPTYAEPTAYAPPPQPQAYPTQQSPCGSPVCAGYLPLMGVPFYNYTPLSPCQKIAPQVSPSSNYVPSAGPTAAPTPTAEPMYTTPACETPIKMSLADQPFRVAPELFEEYYYLLNLAEKNRL